MLTLSAKKRDLVGKKTRQLRKKGILPAVLYGFKIKNLNLEVDLKEFKKIYQEAGTSSLISLEVEKKKIPVLIKDFQKDPLSGEFLHVDFYHPSLKEEVEAFVPLEFVGEAPAVKELGATLIKHLDEIEVRALPLDLPHEIKVDLSSLKGFDDEILVKDLKVPQGVKILTKPEEIVVSLTPPEKLEEELEKPIEEEIIEPEVVGQKKEKEEEE